MALLSEARGLCPERGRPERGHPAAQASLGHNAGCPGSWGRGREARGDGGCGALRVWVSVALHRWAGRPGLADTSAPLVQCRPCSSPGLPVVPFQLSLTKADTFSLLGKVNLGELPSGEKQGLGSTYLDRNFCSTS